MNFFQDVKLSKPGRFLFLSKTLISSFFHTPNSQGYDDLEKISKKGNKQFQKTLLFQTCFPKASRIKIIKLFYNINVKIIFKHLVEMADSEQGAAAGPEPPQQPMAGDCGNKTATKSSSRHRDEVCFW